MPEEATVVFALQPFTPRVEKQWTEEELALFAILDETQGEQWHKSRDALHSEWDDYAALLARGCEALGVPFVDLSTAAYDGWCFVDRVHATDRGYDAAAEVLAEFVPAGDRSAVYEPAPASPEPSERAAEQLEGEDDPNVYPLW